MKKALIFFVPVLLCCHLFSLGQREIHALPVWNDSLGRTSGGDWLVSPVNAKAEVYRSADLRNIVLYNGLVKRAFRIRPNAACMDYRNMTSSQQLLRAVKPEARITINGICYDVGGLHGQTENAYLLPRWINDFVGGARDFQFVRCSVNPIVPFIQWKPVGWAMNKS